MKGFIKKDLLFLKGSIKLYAVICILYIIMAFQGEMEIFSLSPFFSFMLMFTTFSYDAYNNWDAYAITLPSGRENAVKAKYVITILLSLTINLFIFVLGLVISYLKKQPINILLFISTLLIVNFVTLLLQSIMYPVIYKVGIDKARIIVFLLVVIIAILAGIFIKFIDITNFIDSSSFLKRYGAVLTLPASFLCLAISFWISYKIYLKKEF